MGVRFSRAPMVSFAIDFDLTAFSFVLCCFFAIFCLCGYTAGYLKIFRLILFNFTALSINGEARIIPTWYPVFRSVSLSSARSITRGLSRFLLDAAVACQLCLIVMFIAFCVFCATVPAAAPFHCPIPDSFSLSFVGLTLSIFSLCFALLLKETHRNLVIWCGALFLLEGFLLLAFLTKHILVFYVSFEATLLPMYLLIGCWGSRARKIKANYYFFLYTLFGSLVTLVGLILLYHGTGSFSFNTVTLLFSNGQNASDSVCSLFGVAGDRTLWLLLSAGFLFKLPLFVFHLWLPEAHVEAPTIGSIILAALLLKLGVYGFVRLPFTLLPYATSFWFPWLLPFLLLGLFYPAAIAAIHDDMKKIIAYSSVAHMASVLLGLMTRTIEGVSGSAFLAIGHGVISGGLFAVIGLFYDRYRTRDLKYFGGLSRAMPFTGFFLLLLTFGNMGFPFLCNFPGELLILLGSAGRFSWVIVFLGVSFFLTAVYSLRVVNIILSGSSKYWAFVNFYDVTRSEAFVLFSFCGATFLLGLMAAPLTHALSLTACSYISV